MGLLRTAPVCAVMPQLLPESLFASGGFRCWNRMFRGGFPFVVWLTSAADDMIDGFLIQESLNFW
jgi:hypothetical protein